MFKIIYTSTDYRIKFFKSIELYNVNLVVICKHQNKAIKVEELKNIIEKEMRSISYDERNNTDSYKRTSENLCWDIFYKINKYIDNDYRWLHKIELVNKSTTYSYQRDYETKSK